MGRSHPPWDIHPRSYLALDGGCCIGRWLGALGDDALFTLDSRLLGDDVILGFDGWWWGFLPFGLHWWFWYGHSILLPPLHLGWWHWTWRGPLIPSRVICHHMCDLSCIIFSYLSFVQVNLRGRPHFIGKFLTFVYNWVLGLPYK